MSAVEDQDTLPVAIASAPKPRRRRLRAILAVFTTQYMIVAILAGVSVAAMLSSLVTPQIVARFEMIAAALKR